MAYLNDSTTENSGGPVLKATPLWIMTKYGFTSCILSISAYEMKNLVSFGLIIIEPCVVDVVDTTGTWTC